MKKILIILSVVISTFGLASCSKNEPTRDIVIYNEELLPTVVSNSLISELAIGEQYQWDVVVSAVNGIKEIYLNEQLAVSYERGQLIHSGGLTVEIPTGTLVGSQYPLDLVIVDEIGLQTKVEGLYSLTVLANQDAPYKIFDFSTTSTFISYDETEYWYPEFVLHPENYNLNNGWIQMEMDAASSDIEGVSMMYWGIPWKDDEILYHATSSEIAGHKALKFQHHHVDITASMGSKTINYLYFGECFDQDYVEQVTQSGERYIMLDIYVDTSAAATATTDGQETCDFSLDSHSLLAFAFGNYDKFYNANDNSKGITYPCIANMTTTDEWETVKFRYSTVYHKDYDTTVTSDIMNMVTMYIPALDSGGTAPNAVYYIKNLRFAKEGYEN